MAKKIKEVSIIEHANGEKFVKRNVSWVRRVWTIVGIVSVLWLAFVAYAPFYVQKNYAQPLKKSIVVSMFFDLQRNIQEEYTKLLKGIAGAIDLKKPVGAAIEKVKMVEGKVEKVSNATAKAKDTTKKASKLTGLIGKFGVDTSAADSAISDADKAVAKVDDTTKLVNDKLDKVKSELERVAQTEIDKALDAQIKKFLDKQTGIGTTLLTNYGIKHVMPWKPSTWPVTTKIYNDLEKSDLSVLQSLTALVDTYFGYVMWGIMGLLWLVGLIIWAQLMKYAKLITAPFVVCPRCGYTFTDKKRLTLGLLKIFQPWKWFM
ncbi:MAG: hypothetical protein LBL75_00555 [Rickettsiales bacterium]|jgi:hypothetical protein|nr:hypothetical protein [Rickettsiales bacterium]